MLNIRYIFLAAAFLVILAAAIVLVTGTTAVVSAPSGDPVSVPDQRDRTESQITGGYYGTYRSRLDECFDVPLRELANCDTASQTILPSYHPQLDECYDVSLRELASCRNAGQAAIP